MTVSSTSPTRATMLRPQLRSAAGELRKALRTVRTAYRTGGNGEVSTPSRALHATLGRLTASQ